ncbi:MAG: two-component sensor histidine kinase, partial [Micrococcaceae bacterium]|nr:two-component sensor histidine kinase [Micrococcaceae bacterium]
MNAVETAKEGPAPEAQPAGKPRWHHRALGGLARARRAIRSRWTRSLLFRTVTSAVLLTTLALMGAGAFLSNQIATGLFQ